MVAYITETYPATTFINREISSLVRIGCHVIVLALRRPELLTRDESHGPAPMAVEYADGRLLWIFRIWYTHLSLFLSRPTSYLRTASRLACDTFGSWWMLPRAVYGFLKAGYLAKLIGHWPVRHIHAFYAGRTTDVAWIISGLTDIPYSFAGISHDIEGNYPFLEQKLAGASFVVTASERIQKISCQKANGETPSKFHVIRTGVDPESFCPAKQDEATPPIIISVTRLIPSKGLDVLIGTCALLRDRGVEFKCRIIGSGPQQFELERLIRLYELVGIVELIGFLEESDVIASLQEAQVFSLPCLDVPAGAQDGLPAQFVPVIRDDIPVSLIEAMATGLPVVSTNQSSIPELVDDQVNGLLVPSGEQLALADALELLLSDDDLRKRLGKNARDKVLQEFDSLECARRLRALFEVTMSSE